MKRQSAQKLFAAILILVTASAVGLADDRVLLRAEGAPANVLLILDSGASMTHDPMTNSVNFMAGGDDGGQFVDAMENRYGASVLQTKFGLNWQNELRKGSKLFQAKSALLSFFSAGFDFNWGFSYYEKTGIEIRYLNFIYRIPEDVDTDNDGVPDDSQDDMLNGTTVGSALRFGSDVQQRGNQDPAPFYTIRYGIDGEDVFIENDDPFGTNTGGSNPATDDFRLVSYLVSSLDESTAVPLSTLTYDQRKSRNLFYFPAYHWGNTGNASDDGISWNRWVRDALKGVRTWEEVADRNNIDTSDPSWERKVHDYAIEDITRAGDPWTQPLGTLSNSNNIGGKRLWIKEELQIYEGNAAGWVPVDHHDARCPIDPTNPLAGRTYEHCAHPQITEVHFQEQFVLYDKDPTTDVPTSTNTLSAVDYQGSADCVGYLDLGQGAPIVPMAVPDPGTGATPDQRWMIEPYLGPQTQPVFYFPMQSPRFYPTVRDNYIPLTESITAIGRRPIKDSIGEARFYFDNNIANWNDPLANCRMNFVILITDGLETCSNLTAPCSAASNIAPTPVYVIYFGTDENALATDLTTVTCVADNSGGLAFSAADEQGLINALTRIAFDIEERTRGFASPIVPSVETTSNQTAYISTFTPKQSRTIWRGHLRAYPIDPLTGLIANLRIDFTPNPLEANWDAGDTLAVREANTRKLYYGVPAYGTDMPGDREPFLFSNGTSTEEEWARWYLGTEIFTDEPWLDPVAFPSTATVGEDPDKVAELEAAVNFIRGVTMVRDPNDYDNILTYGRDPNQYGWCSSTGDQNDGDAEPCQLSGAQVAGVEKMGDIFHSTPQLIGPPRCFTCWFQNFNGYRDDYSTTALDDGFATQHSRRRQVLFAGSNDGSMHAFDAGLWDPDGGVIDGETIDPIYDMGSARELFAWIPNATMDTLDELAFGGEHKWSVDGTVTVADVFIDKEFSDDPVASGREWRTLALFGQRRGGRSYVALDITQPDPYDSNYEPLAIGNVTIDPWQAALTTGRDAQCATGATTGCDGPWPAFRWEFRDTDVVNELPRDEDANLEPDLGQTWSRPIVAFLKVDGDNDNTTPADDKMVAFFGGGYSPDGLSAWQPTGNFIYGIDVETGLILFKEQVAGMVPSDLGAVDIDIDGFLEAIYFGDTEGYVYKIDFTVEGLYENVAVPLLDFDPFDGIAPITVTEKRVTNWVPQVIFTASFGQPFFMRPVLAPVTFQADGTPILAVAIGSGNRDEIMDANPLPHTFYVFLDKAPSGGFPVDETDLVGFTLGTLANATDNYLDGATDFGWFLRLEGNGNFTPASDDWEKVNTPALILQGQVIFSTFNPSSDVQEVPILDEDGDVIGYACRRGGNARTYVLNLTNGNAPDGGDRFIQHDSGTAMATEPVVYLGADGEIHVIQALDNLKLEEPVESFNVKVRAVNWKEQ